MKNASPEVDAYIASAPEYARPILEKIRAQYHAACPAIEEAIKWGHPSFMSQGMVGGMAAFKEHVSIGFWRAREIEGIEAVLERESGGSFGARKMSTVKDLPKAADFKAVIKRAVTLNAEIKAKPGAAKKKAVRKTTTAIEIPEALMAALKKNKKALAGFEAFSPSCKREYAEWIADAKRDETRERRIATAIEWIAEGKPRNWKYKNC